MTAGDNADPGLPPAIRRLLSEFRVPNGEVQLTKIIEAFCADPSVCAGFVGAILTTVQPRHRWLRDQVPSRMLCVAEHPLRETASGGERRVDLVFRDVASNFCVYCELKLRAGYSDGQLTDYAHALNTHPATTKALVAITTWPQWYGEAEVNRDPLWIGSLRWRDVLPRLQAIRAQDDLTTEMWTGMLAHIERDGDFGPMTRSFDVLDMARLWANPRAANDALRALLGEIAEPAERAIRQQLPLHELQRNHDRSLDYLDGRHLGLRFASSATALTAEIKFHKAHGQPYLSVDLWHPRLAATRQHKPLAEATARLRDAPYRFHCEADKGGFYWSSGRDASEVLLAGEEARRMISEVDFAVEAWRSSGLLAAMA